MEPFDAKTSSQQPRTELIERFQDALESMEWQNRQVVEKVVLGRQHLTLPQLTVLRVLSEAEGELDMRELSLRSSLPHGSVTAVMDRLVLRRFAERQEQSSGGCVICRITPEGIEALRGFRQSRLELVERTLQSYSDDDVRLLGELVQRWGEIAAEIIREESENQPIVAFPAS